MTRHERKLHERALVVAQRTDVLAELLLDREMPNRKLGEPIPMETAEAVRGQALIMALLEERDLEAM